VRDAIGRGRATHHQHRRDFTHQLLGEARFLTIWLYEPPYMRDEVGGAFWPGGLVRVSPSGPPAIERLLDGRSLAPLARARDPGL
jgi:hypothetical protein